MSGARGPAGVCHGRQRLRGSVSLSAVSDLTTTAIPLPLHEPVPAAPAQGLVDQHGRVARDIRISLTDRCNLRCEYCMPAAGLPWQPREQHLTADEIVSLAELLVGLGIRTIRLTGGEPLLRRDLAEIVRRLHAIEGLEDLALTTNGVLLERQAAALAAAGGVRLNVSIDSADPEHFKAVTRRDDLARVLAGLREATRHPELSPIKLNAVALRGVTADSLDGLLDVAASIDAELRFIEPMPLDADRRWTPEDGLSGADLRALMERRGELSALPAPPSATAQRFSLRRTVGAGADRRTVTQSVGLIASVTEPFCGACDRLRLTADGQLRSCLFSHEETDLLTPLRAGASQADLAELIRGGVWSKPRTHGIDEPGFEPPARPMSAIGG